MRKMTQLYPIQPSSNLSGTNASLRARLKFGQTKKSSQSRKLPEAGAVSGNLMLQRTVAAKRSMQKTQSIE
jgi:hypothetical protein